MIPKRLHQIWLGPNPPTKWMDTWKNLNPSWEYKLWTEADLPLQFASLPSFAAKSDAFRYFILFENGGFYADADSECIRPLDDALLDNEAFCSWENEWLRPGLMTGAFLASVKGCPLMRELLNEVEKTNSNFHPAEAWEKVGPMLLTKTICRLRFPITIFPSHYFHPKHYMGLEYKGKGRIYANHFWQTTGILKGN